MFLSVEWAKRWLPAVFLLLSLFLPWWMWTFCEPYFHFNLFFPWDGEGYIYILMGRYYVNYFPAGQYMSFSLGFDVPFYRLPVSCFVSGLIFVSGLFGLSVKRKIRTLGGLLGIAGITSYFALVLARTIRWFTNTGWSFSDQMSNFPYFGFVPLEYLDCVMWFLSIGFYLALAGSLMLLLPLIRTLTYRKIKKWLRTDSSLRFKLLIQLGNDIRKHLELCRRCLSVEWAKRWLPAVFLLLSLFLPWWMFDRTWHSWERGGRGFSYEPGYKYLYLSFPWDDRVDASILYYSGPHYFDVGFDMVSEISFYHLPVSCFVSALIFMSGLFGLSVKRKIRTLAGLLGIAGITSYFALVLPESLLSIVNVYYPLAGQTRDFPYFGSALTETLVLTWFLSAGFYLALAGSLMLLSPLIRTLIEKLKKRLKSSELQPNTLSEENSETQTR